MNKVIEIGRLTKDPEVQTTSGGTIVGKYTIAVKREYKNQNGEFESDFIRCIAFGKSAEFAGNYLKIGTKICVTGRIQTGSYTNKENATVYTTDVIVEHQEFVEPMKS